MVWPQRGQRDGFRRVSDSYRLAADASRALLLPAGDAWREIAQRAPDVHVYGRDGLHPTVEGSYLAALVIAGEVAGVAADEARARLELTSGARIEIAEDDARVLRAAARRVSHTTGRPSAP